ncbi:Zn-dependent hydrolase [Hyphococcus flavus]|uniref:Zn-dependent hydrolase n=1 Tax=Hyphococcus flavus TaxID=1866326 RepID=A0AAF0CDR2_9PROT|nr:Zn-dependent hydrolase [Hyphococcus flavus]WDI30116.1 Zn-dependent hydrolase [Hyphococcus flavus]
MPPEITINGDRLWESLMAMAEIGATAKGGVCRLAASEADKAGRELFIKWCVDAGCEIVADEIGNLFAKRAGEDTDALPVVMGSHLDSQPTGGKFDGVYGVLAGLEVIRSLNDAKLSTRAPVEVAVWMNEEGARFSPAMLGSGVFAGAFSLDYGLGRTDKDGVALKAALVQHELAGIAPVGRKLGAHFEAHIEQGPILEAEKKTIGVVTGVQGIVWFDVVIAGSECHAGPTPMEMRIDPVQKAASLLTQFFTLAREYAPHARVTVGEIHSHPSSRNTVPGKVQFSLDLRHPEPAILQTMHRKADAIVKKENLCGAPVSLEEIWHSPPVAFDENCITAVSNAAAKTGYPFKEMVSGAGHDSVYISRVAPTAMIFVPCKGGISHNEAESAEPHDLAAGCNVLLHAVLEYAGLCEI